MPLDPPVIARAGVDHTATVRAYRREITDILAGNDDRIVAIVGPCSVHDVESMQEYALRLAHTARAIRSEVCVVARVYTEKPRSRHGWPGLMLDPDLDGSFRVNKGIAMSRQIMSDVVSTGLPVATEFVEPTLTPYVEDLTAWGAIGARTVESPTHRRLVAGLNLPVGFKNRADGAVSPAVDAIAAVQESQALVTVDDQGRSTWDISAGNAATHLVLRGGESGTNFDDVSVRGAIDLAAQVQTNPRLVIDCSHGNSGKDYLRQPIVADAVADQISQGQDGIAGVMLESFIEAGKQPLGPALEYGVSVTDSCMDIDTTQRVLKNLAEAVRNRRRLATTRTLMKQDLASFAHWSPRRISPADTAGVAG